MKRVSLDNFVMLIFFHRDGRRYISDFGRTRPFYPAVVVFYNVGTAYTLEDGNLTQEAFQRNVLKVPSIIGNSIYRYFLDSVVTLIHVVDCFPNLTEHAMCYWPLWGRKGL
jgi:hypothetical protein